MVLSKLTVPKNLQKMPGTSTAYNCEDSVAEKSVAALSTPKLTKQHGLGFRGVGFCCRIIRLLTLTLGQAWRGLLRCKFTR